jgi:exodeoxyribonuclease VII small subunit
MPKESKDAKRETFEQIYAKLEAHVEKLEQGNLSLEASIALYEEGMTLARSCQERLDEAEQKITKLKESFANMPQRANGARVDDSADAPLDYEYVSEDDDSIEPAEDLP